MKRCSGCHETKPEDQFHLLRRRGKEERQRLCKPCAYTKRREWVRANPEKARAQYRRKSLKSRYGLTVEGYEALHAQQRGCCAICGQPEKVSQVGGEPQRLAVDHCHDTGAVRGLLCYSCNRTLGQIGDSVEGVMRFVRYLQRTQFGAR